MKSACLAVALALAPACAAHAGEWAGGDDTSASRLAAALASKSPLGKSYVVRVSVNDETDGGKQVDEFVCKTEPDGGCERIEGALADILATPKTPEEGKVAATAFGSVLTGLRGKVYLISDGASVSFAYDLRYDDVLYRYKADADTATIDLPKVVTSQASGFRKAERTGESWTLTGDVDGKHTFRIYAR